MDAPPRLVAEGLACERGGRRVFEGLGFALAPGEALQVEGRNGAGKSSLLRLLGGLLRPAAGNIANPFRIAFAGHDLALKPLMRLDYELAHWAQLDGAAPGAVEAALAAFDLTGLADLPVAVLSSGQKRRAALARVAASGAALWLLDEPGVGLDSASMGRLGQVMAGPLGHGGLIVAATHGDIGLAAPARLELG